MHLQTSASGDMQSGLPRVVVMLATWLPALDCMSAEAHRAAAVDAPKMGAVAGVRRVRRGARWGAPAATPRVSGPDRGVRTCPGSRGTRALLRVLNSSTGQRF
jgi:hypothetical protein